MKPAPGEGEQEYRNRESGLQVVKIPARESVAKREQYGVAA